MINKDTKILRELAVAYARICNDPSNAERALLHCAANDKQPWN